MDLPSDLIPLPTSPWHERPLEVPLDIEECRTAIWRAGGNITEASKLLKITSLRLRAFIRNSPYLSAEMQEAKDQIVDIAESVVVDALTDDEDKSRRDTMARFVLGSQGKSRGWGSGQAGNLNIKNTGGTVIVKWQDGSTFGEEPPEEEMKTIDAA